MPRELVYSKEALSGQVADAVVEHVAVGWSKGDGLVQLGVVHGDKVKVTIDGGDDVVSGLWMDLDREQINRLIRSLRRARDSAYGADA